MAGAVFQTKTQVKILSIELPPSAKMAIRLLKQERDETGGPMLKIWSHAIKVAAIKEVLKNPDKDHWHEAKLPQRFAEIRNALQEYLRREVMPDPYFPEVNLLKRIKSSKIKQELSRHLSNSAKKMVIGDAKNVLRALTIPTYDPPPPLCPLSVWQMQQNVQDQSGCLSA